MSNSIPENKSLDERLTAAYKAISISREALEGIAGSQDGDTEYCKSTADQALSELISMGFDFEWSISQQSDK